MASSGTIHSTTATPINGEGFTVNGVRFPMDWYPVVDALLVSLQRVKRERVTGELVVQLQLKSGGVCDKFVTVKERLP